MSCESARDSDGLNERSTLLYWATAVSGALAESGVEQANTRETKIQARRKEPESALMLVCRPRNGKD